MRDPVLVRGRRDLSTLLPPLQGSTTLPDRLYAELETAIISGVLAPGERLHAGDLAAHFGVSLIPVREALRSLDQAGWVDITPRLGVHVRERTATELCELFELRGELEGLVAQWAAQRRTAADLVRLEAALLASAAVPRADAEALLDASAEFRDALRAAAHNSVVAATSAALEKRARFYFSTVTRELGRDWMRVHEQVCALVRAQDGPAAADLTREHILGTGDAVRALLFA